jgi:hypothetical protein
MQCDFLGILLIIYFSKIYSKFNKFKKIRRFVFNKNNKK